MVDNKYENLMSQSPKTAADIVGEVEKQNYFAHSIREIELAILLNQGKHYHITTYSTKTGIKKARITFHDNCCDIRLPAEHEEMDDKRIRLILAHELGHLVYNIKDLSNPEILENRPKFDGQEKFAWEFAYHLVKKKSDEYKEIIGNQMRKYSYSDNEIKRTLFALVKEKVCQDLCDNIKKSLN